MGTEKVLYGALDSLIHFPPPDLDKAATTSKAEAMARIPGEIAPPKKKKKRTSPKESETGNGPSSDLTNISTLPPSSEYTNNLQREFEILTLRVNKLTAQLDAAAQSKSRRTPKRTLKRQSEPCECQVCGDEFFECPNASQKCSHPRMTCRPCLSQWIHKSLEDSAGQVNVRCPDADCNRVLAFTDVKKFADPEDFERYDQLQTRAALNDLPNFVWCIGPHCDSGQIYDGSEFATIFTCAACEYRACTSDVHHPDAPPEQAGMELRSGRAIGSKGGNIRLIPWHTGETCEDYEERINYDPVEERRREEEAQSALEIARVSKRCPNQRCGWNIQKRDGCDHMTCRMCSYEFCWICLADWRANREPRGYGHICPTHRPNNNGR
ncbi:hypothetical protein P152DRAFT_459926 [Eremomyces bilateralis CBS 781.70]|uniref:RBR-type E3 ubiquitin transferase n=1 Tax=Eremomyces bilateralis CBS 781.70 TaxID=1392243 RepID=A0A6G1FZQ9_9PEZI|nr:uncharacterized protein P152DRAFT_459926 [Eremomyces bilateralis CBS 781.70]KAF1811049.1 hypothetical protein P152DRAFT_459926 [Eremomyces bilateralis CBS 781.70]